MTAGGRQIGCSRAGSSVKVSSAVLVAPCYHRSVTEDSAQGLPDLHDAILVGVTVAWGEAVAEVHLCEVGSVSETILVFNRLRSLHCTRTEPWGPSVYINRAALSHRSHLRIELQSGDEIEIVAEGLTIRR